MNPAEEKLDRIDRRVVSFMRRFRFVSLRIALAVIYIWFGILKPLGLSEAEPMVEKTVAWMPFFTPPTWVNVIGWWEVAIGVLFLFRPTIRIAVALLLLQMVGTFMPLVLLTEVTFQPGRIPYAPTLEGQYVIKNLLIIAAAIAVGGTVRQTPTKQIT